MLLQGKTAVISGAASRRGIGLATARLFALQPDMDDEMVTAISERYIELYEKVTGLSFNKTDYQAAPFRIEENINAWLKKSGI